MIHRDWDLALYLPSWTLNSINSETLCYKPFKNPGLRTNASLFLNDAFISKEQLLFFTLFSLSSYCNMNVLCFSQYRSYSKGIPSYLHDKPQEFVLHCLERQKIALGSDFSGTTCANNFLQVLKNFHHGHSMLIFPVSELIFINTRFFISN